MKSSHHADIKGKGILYEDDDAPIKLVDRDDSFVIKELGLTLIGKVTQPSLERSDVFNRVQLPVRQSARDTHGNDRNYHQSSLMKREMYTRNSQEYEARPDLRNRLGESNNNYSRSWGKDRSERGHAGRIIRRKDEFKRSDRYGGGRARTGPYDRNDGRSWRVKPKLNNATDSDQNGNGVANKRNEIVPYEHFLGAGSHDPLNSGGDLSSREGNKEDTSGTRKLASAIVTPSRVRSSENVTVRGRVDEVADARLLTFTGYGSSKRVEQFKPLVIKPPTDDEVDDGRKKVMIFFSTDWNRIREKKLKHIREDEKLVEGMNMTEEMLSPTSFARQVNEQLALAKAFVVIAKESKNLQFAWDLSAQIRNSQLLLSTAASSIRP
ncbi:hypothetical protein YC2023_089092 [Brassica napus]